MIGYKPVVVKEVVVNMNLTSTVNIEMTTEALGLEEVVVVAERPIVKKDISNSQMSIQTATLENVPITTIGDALTLQAGIQMGTSGLVVRGGDANQTVFMVDGFSTNDERSNNPYVAVSISAVEEIRCRPEGSTPSTARPVPELSMQ
jgi:outer membrane receptor protein involved in Fe transport